MYNMELVGLPSSYWTWSGGERVGNIDALRAYEKYCQLCEEYWKNFPRKVEPLLLDLGGTSTLPASGAVVGNSTGVEAGRLRDRAEPIGARVSGSLLHGDGSVPDTNGVGCGRFDDERSIGVCGPAVVETGRCNEDAHVNVVGGVPVDGQRNQFVSNEGDFGTVNVQDHGADASNDTGLECAGCVSPKTLANRQRRAERKERKARRREAQTNFAWESLQRKWDAQNELEAEKARQELKITRMRDIDQEWKRRERATQRSIESSKVAIERAHNSLSRCETVVTNAPTLSSGSVSPNSSVSNAEIMAMKKENEDLKFQLAQVQKQNHRNEEYCKFACGQTAVFTAPSAGPLAPSICEDLNQKFGDEWDCDRAVPGTALIRRLPISFGDMEDVY